MHFKMINCLTEEKQSYEKNMGLEFMNQKIKQFLYLKEINRRMGISASSETQLSSDDEC